MSLTFVVRLAQLPLWPRHVPQEARSGVDEFCLAGKGVGPSWGDLVSQGALWRVGMGVAIASFVKTITSPLRSPLRVPERRIAVRLALS